MTATAGLSPRARAAALGLFSVVALAVLALVAAHSFATREGERELWRAQQLDARAQFDAVADDANAVHSKLQASMHALRRLQAVMMDSSRIMREAVAEGRAANARLLNLGGQLQWAVDLVTTVHERLANYRLYVLRVAVVWSPSFAIIYPAPNHLTLPSSLSALTTWLFDGSSSGALQYLMGIAVQGGIAIAVGFLFSFIGFWFWCGRACRCCGARIPDPRGYNWCKLCFPLILLWVLMAGVVIGAFFALVGNEQVTSGTTSLFTVVTNLSSNVSTIATSATAIINTFSSNLNGWVTDLQAIINSISNITTIVFTISSNVTSLSTEFAPIATRLYETNTNLTVLRFTVATLNQFNVSGAPAASTVPSIPDATLAQVSAAQTLATSTATTVANLAVTINQTIVSLQAQFSASVSSIASQIIGYIAIANGTISMVGTMLGSIGGQISGYQTMVAQYQFYREIATIVPVGIVLLLFFLSCFFGIFQTCGCICLPQWCSCCLGFWVMPLWFLLMLFFAIHYIIALFLSDTCVTLLPTLPDQIGSFVTLPAPLNTLNFTALLYCQNPNGTGDNLFDILGFSSYLNVSLLLGGLSVSSLTSSLSSLDPTSYLSLLDQFNNITSLNFTSSVNGTALAELLDAVNANVTSSALGANFTQVQQLIDALNQITVPINGKSFTADNVTLAVPSEYGSYSNTVVTLRDNATALYQLYIYILNVTTSLKYNLTVGATTMRGLDSTFTSINTLNQHLNTTITAVRANVNNVVTVKNNVVSSLGIINTIITTAQALLNQAYLLGDCAFIRIAYTGLISGLCTQLGGGLDTIWMGYGVVSLLSFPGAVIGVIGATRYGWSRKNIEKHPEKWDRLQSRRRGYRRNQHQSAPRNVPMEPMNQRVRHAYHGSQMDQAAAVAQMQNNMFAQQQAIQAAMMAAYRDA